MKIDKELEKIINSYYENNGKKLHTVVNQIFNRNFGGTFGKDMPEFYSVAGEILMEILKKDSYNSKQGNFEGYFYRALKKGIIDEFKRQQRDKRCTKIYEIDKNGEIVLDKNGKPKRIPVQDIRLDAPIKDGENTTIGEQIQSDFNMDDNILKKINANLGEKTEKYLSELSKTEKDIAKLLMEDYTKNDIKKILGLSDCQFQKYWKSMTSYDKKRILYKEDVEDGEMNDTILETMDTSEKYKDTSYSISSISKRLHKKHLRDDHILQRHSGQWRSFAKSELVSDILRGKSLTQIIISEEIKDGLKMQWLIDGKQRCTTLDDYLHDGFSISKNVKNPIVRYQGNKLDENGNEILNEDGFTIMEWKTFDIRGKKFSKLPEELQDIFRDRQIPVLYNMNCTKKDIADDIARFNRSRPMNKAQNGWLGLDEDFAETVDNIAKMDFFKKDFCGSTYTDGSYTSGAIRRIIIESIMVSDFIDDFCDFDKMCEFLSEEASDSNFTEFYSLVERLMAIADGKGSKLFNAKDSFLWFGLFSRFNNLGLEDKKFLEFMSTFEESLHAKKINEMSFDDILATSKSTKDKNIVIKKMNHLENLMKDYFDTLGNNDDIQMGLKIPEKFIAENLHLELEEVKEDMELYKESLDDLVTNTIKDGSKLLEDQNKLSLLTMVAYSYQNDVDLDEWMTEYAQNNNTYFVDQKKNYLHMLEDFKIFSKNKTRIIA